MIPATSFAGKKVAVFGIGVSGLAAAASLAAGGADVHCWDDGDGGRDAARGAGFTLTDLRSAAWQELAALVLAPGVPLTHPAPHWTVEMARGAGIEIIGDTEIFCRERRAARASTAMLGITGTNGKSTTTALTHHLLATAGLPAHLGGNIGRAVLDMPGFAAGQHYVIEYSSFQIDLTPTLDADAAALLNITPDHLDRHGTLENYAAVKAHIFAHLRPGATSVIGVDDPLSTAIAAKVEARGVPVVRISAARPVADGIFFSDGDLVEAKAGRITHRAAIGGIRTLRGPHNGQNAAAAAALALACGLDWAAIEAGLRTFPGLPHRLEETGRLGHVLFVNDSKATNADAAARALATFTDIYWIAGGKPKAGGLSGLEPYFGRVRKAYLIGEAAPGFARALEGRLPFLLAETVENAVAAAARDALADTAAAEPVVLLAPACASYDQFPNFEVRGMRFRECVAALDGVTVARAQAA